MRVVLVHGAWADGSCWAGVIRRLQAAGHDVIAPQMPHTSLADDVDRVRHVLRHGRRADGRSPGTRSAVRSSPPSAPMPPNVVGLVYVAAFGLEEGESIGALLAQGEPTPALAHLRIDDLGFAWLPQDDFVGHFAADVDPADANVMYAVQQPLAAIDARRRDGRRRRGGRCRRGTSSPRTTRRSRRMPSDSSRSGWAPPRSR